MNAPATTPLMKQFFALKEECPDALLFFRMGDFYELFGDDAVTAAPILGITLTSRDKKAENPIPMAGLPFHSAQNYIQKLLRAGKKVAIAEQMTDPETTKGIVERKIIRTFTPAVQFESDQSAKAHYLSLLVPSGDEKFVLVLLDPSTGGFKASDRLTFNEIRGLSIWSEIAHLLYFSKSTPFEVLSEIKNQGSLLCEELPENFVSRDEMDGFLKSHYSDSVFIEEKEVRLGCAFLIRYVLRAQQIEKLEHLRSVERLDSNGRLHFGPNTLDHLDFEDLYQFVNRTETAMGARALRDLVYAPYATLSEIHDAQNNTKTLSSRPLSRDGLKQKLRSIYDLDRLMGRVTTGLAHPRDALSLGQSLKSVLDFSFELSQFLEIENSKSLLQSREQLREHLLKVNPLMDRILSTLNEEAPLHTRDGGIFKKGADSRLDHWIDLSINGERFLVDLETRERERTGISSLKVKYNRVFGYFIEVSSANLSKVPSDYQRKQTMVGGERFFTEELKKFEEEILTAEVKRRALEQELFQDLIQSILKESLALREISKHVSKWDVWISLSTFAQEPGYRFPTLDDSRNLNLQQFRHPLIEKALKQKYVASDLVMNTDQSQTIIITGPNMGGKSTLMRAAAWNIIFSQMGAPIPAETATFGYFTEIYTRIGAHDAIAKGQSTFMVEMVELAHILKHAGPRSFVVLDEVGRGTSTFDGMSVARASLEYLHLRSQARILFATHYHELTDLSDQFSGIENRHMKVIEDKHGLTFLYELSEGRSSKSFGIQVAAIAGLPKDVIQNAWKTLKKIESSQGHSQEQDPNQMSLFDLVHQDQSLIRNTEPSETDNFLIGLKTELEGLDLNEMRPIDAFQRIVKWKEGLQG